jgi:hypothetical protein
MGRGTTFTAEEQARIIELSAQRVPGRMIARELGRSSHRAVWAYVMKLRQPSPAARRRWPHDLGSPEISRQRFTT